MKECNNEADCNSGGGSRRGLQDPWRDGLSRQGSWDQPSWGGNGASGRRHADKELRVPSRLVGIINHYIETR
jgi:hypothetical protein